MFLFCRITAYLLLAALVVLSGCGRKTALIPPQELVPVAISDLRPTLDENGVTLKWTYPARLKNGDALPFIESFTVFRAAMPEENFCEGCPVEFRKSAEIAGGYLPQSGENRTAKYTEGSLQNGYRYLYKVRSHIENGFTSGDSNVISFIWQPPPKAPQGLQIEPGDRKLSLRWLPVRENIHGNALEAPLIYRVYRKKRKAPFVELDESVQEPLFIDNGLENDTLYSYRVRAFVQIGGTLQAGQASQVISASPRDLTPPPPPPNLTAIETPSGIKLIWQSVTGEDIAGYRIYRREENAQQAELIKEVGSDQSQYVDQDKLSGRKIFYSVTSFDKAEPANESPPSLEAIIDLQ